MVLNFKWTVTGFIYFCDFPNKGTKEQFSMIFIPNKQ